jgi:hypothetical protein
MASRLGRVSNGQSLAEFLKKQTTFPLSLLTEGKVVLDFSDPSPILLFTTGDVLLITGPPLLPTVLGTARASDRTSDETEWGANHAMQRSIAPRPQYED